MSSQVVEAGLRLLLVLVCFGACCVSAAHAACSCGPDFCVDDSRIPSALAAKKQSLSREFPSKLVALLDQGVQCVARISRSPDIFTFILVSPDGSKSTLPWSADDQARANSKLSSGELQRYWIVHARRAFSCCEQPSYNQMSDYNANDDVNASLAIRCDATHACP